MSCNDDSTRGDLPFVRWFRRRHPEATGLSLDEGAAERLLDGEFAPDDAPPELTGVAHVLAAARRSPQSDELAGESDARAAFTGRLPTTGRSGRRRRGGGIAVVVAGAFAFGATAAAAATGNLPDPAQDAVSDALDRVGASVSAADEPDAMGDAAGEADARPDSTRPANVVLCDAYAQGAHTESIGVRAVLAVVGEAQVVDFCESAAGNPNAPGSDAPDPTAPARGDEGAGDPPGLDGDTPPGLDGNSPPGLPPELEPGPPPGVTPGPPPGLDPGSPPRLDPGPPPGLNRVPAPVEEVTAPPGERGATSGPGQENEPGGRADAPGCRP